MTPDELVAAACEVADKAVDAFRAKGWVQNVASFADIEKAYDEAKKK